MFGLILFSCLGLAMALSGIPLMLRKVPPNRLYGFRVPATLKDEQVWYEANAHSGLLMLLCGLASLGVTGLAYMVGGHDKDLFAGLAGGGLMLMLAVVVALSFLRLKAILKRKGGA